MTERERLIEHIREGRRIAAWHNYDLAETIADYLLANNVNFVEQGRNITENHPVDEFVCSECGFICEGWTEVVWDEDANDRNNRECEFYYCPKCGSKIEDFWKDEEDNR